MNIHKTAIVEEGAEIAKDVVIGPYSYVSSQTKIASGTNISSHVVIKGKVTIGKNNKIYSFSCIGEEPQDLSYKGEDTEVIIGDDNTLREYVSIHRGTLKQEGKTIIGNQNLVMAYTHLGHDVIVGDETRIVNACNIAGHVNIGDRAIISGGTVVGQFVRIGRGSFIGGGSVIDKEVPHYCTAYGNRIKLKGINIIGLKRMGVEKSDISELVDFFRSMEASNLSPRAFIDSHDSEQNRIVKDFSSFIQESKIGIPSFIS